MEEAAYSERFTREQFVHQHLFTRLGIEVACLGGDGHLQTTDSDPDLFRCFEETQELPVVHVDNGHELVFGAAQLPA
ncbi:hypothetical protein D3C86_1306020 [compost metagenome]